MKDDGIEVVVDTPLRDEGSVVVFSGSTDDSLVTFACDHRMAQALVDALEDGDAPIAIVPEWAILTRSGR